MQPARRRLDPAVNDDEACPERVRQIPARVPARVALMASLRVVAQSIVESGVSAVLVESDAGPVGIVSASDVIQAVAGGADPDLVWAGEIARPAPKVVSCERDPTHLGTEMAAYHLEIVAVMDEGAPLGVATALDVLGAVLQGRQ